MRERAQSSKSKPRPIVPVLLALSPFIGAGLVVAGALSGMVDAVTGGLILAGLVALGEGLAYAVIALSEARNSWPHSFLAGANGLFAVLFILGVLAASRQAVSHPAEGDLAPAQIELTAKQAERFAAVVTMLRSAEATVNERPQRDAVGKHARRLSHAPGTPDPVPGSEEAVLTGYRTKTRGTPRTLRKIL